MTERYNHQEAFEFLGLPSGGKISWEKLRELLLDVPTALFFANAYKLPRKNVVELLSRLFNLPVLGALQEGGHSEELQDYLVELFPEEMVNVFSGKVKAPKAAAPNEELLLPLWEAAQLELAASIQEVADRLGKVLASLPGREGHMAFKTMAKMNRRGTVGSFDAFVKHQAAPKPNLVILDVSGSMTEPTVATIVEDVVRLAWGADAWLAIVSDSCFVWEPGSATVQSILSAAEYRGTHYEELLPLFLEREWGVVTTIADYDSSWSVRSLFRQQARGSIETLLDLSFVEQPTFMAEALSVLAKEVKPLMVGTHDLTYQSYRSY